MELAVILAMPGVQAVEVGGDEPEERQHDGGTGEVVEQTSDRKPVGGGIAAVCGRPPD